MSFLTKPVNDMIHERSELIDKLAAVTAERDNNHQRAEEIIAAREKEIRRLRAVRDALLRERDALREDKARLDWLDESLLDHRAEGEDQEWLWSSWSVETDDELVRDIRAAIDAAKGGHNE